MGCFYLVVLHRQSFKHNRSPCVLLISKIDHRMYSSDQKSKKITRIDWLGYTHTLYLNIFRRTSTDKKSNREGSAEYEGAKVNLGFGKKEESASRENQVRRKTHPTSYLSPDGNDEEKMEDDEVVLCYT